MGHASLRGRFLLLTGRFWPFADLFNVGNQPSRMAAFRVRSQPVDATHWLNRSAGVSKFNVFLGRSFSCLATALSLA